MVDAAVENGVMSRREPLRGTKYAPLLAVLAGNSGDSVTLTLARIEEMIGVALPDGAYVSPSYWESPSMTVPPRLWAMGWRARLRVKERTVTFTRRCEE